MAKKSNSVKSLIAGGKRQAMVEAGAYDGRYRQRVVKDKSKYTRKGKDLGEGEE